MNFYLRAQLFQSNYAASILENVLFASFSLGELIMFSFRFSPAHTETFNTFYYILYSYDTVHVFDSSRPPWSNFLSKVFNVYKRSLSQRTIENAWPINPSAKRTLRTNAKIKTWTQKGIRHNNDIINVYGLFSDVFFLMLRQFEVHNCARRCVRTKRPIMYLKTFSFVLLVKMFIKIMHWVGKNERTNDDCY